MGHCTTICCEEVYAVMSLLETTPCLSQASIFYTATDHLPCLAYNCIAYKAVALEQNTCTHLKND